MPKIVDHDERRAHIVEAVKSIIIREGFDRVTMREIAAEAGYAHGAIVRYFPNKESLLEAAFVHVYVSSHERILTAIDGQRGLPALERMCREILPFGQVAESSRVVLAFWDHAAQNEQLRSLHETYNLRWRQLFRTFLLQARDDGELAQDVDIETAVAEVACRNAGWQTMAVLLPQLSTDQLLENGLRALIRGFAREPETVGR